VGPSGQKGWDLVSGHRWPIVFGIIAGVASGPALAQDLTQGKTPAQLFAGDCATCHKSPQGLARGGDPRSVASFLREHYTTKPDMAQALAGYLVGAGGTARGQPSDRDGSGPKLGNSSTNRASVDTGRSDPNRAVDVVRPRTNLLESILGTDEAKPADSSDPPPKPAAKPRVGAASGDNAKPADADSKPPGKPRSAAADDKDGPKARLAPDAKRNADDGGDGPKSKPRTASRTEDGRKPGDPPAQGSNLNSYARSGSGDKDKVTDSFDTRISKLREYATSGDTAPAPSGAPGKAVGVPTAVVAPAAINPSTGDSSVSDTEKASPADASKPEEAAKPASIETPSPAAEEPPKPAPARKSSDAGRPSQRTDATGSTRPSSPMSFFGRIFTGGAKPREAPDPPN
jgi:hypothetical protein